MDLEGLVNVRDSSSCDGVKRAIRLDDTGAVIVSNHYPRRYLSSLEDDKFRAMNPLGTPVTTQAGLSATTPMLTLYNPVGSGVNLVIESVSLGITSAPASSSVIVLAYNALNAGAPTSVTLANVTSTRVGSPAQPSGQCYRVSTLPATPIAFSIIGCTLANNSTATVQLTRVYDGSIIVAPGVSISIQTSSALSGVATFTWIEEPVRS